MVIITTKKGKNNERAKVSYDGYVGMQKATNVLEMSNSSQYAQMLREGEVADYLPMLQASVAKYGGNFEQNQYNSDTDWYDELLRTAVITNHSLNISGGTDKANYGVGMSYFQIMRQVVLPQAFRTAFPSLFNSIISMVKETSLASTITVTEMFRQAIVINGRVYETLALYTEVALIYLAFCSLLTVAQHWGEKKLSSYGGVR